jgi:DNA replication and repair protein RecF
MRGMYLRSLHLTNYRNFRRLALNLGDEPTIIQADNAQGKTNLLEAIELLATTKSSRAGSDRELIHWAVTSQTEEVSAAEAFGRISAVVANLRGETKADVVLRLLDGGDDGLGPGVSKSFRVNGLPRRALEFVGEINVVSFSPEDVDLVAGPPAGRRRYLDVTNGQMSSRYLRALQRFNKVLTQRNQLLRQVREQGQHGQTLPVWDQELATNGAYIFQERARSIAGLNAFADRWFRDLGGWGQRLEIGYKPALAEPEGVVLRSVPAESDAALGAIHSAFMQALERGRQRDVAAGVSLIGPHRDDLCFVVDGVDMNTYGSRGQQRLAALSLKLAELDLLAARVGSRPILLLDDVLSELDAGKQMAVLRAAAGEGQTLLTVTHTDAVDRTILPNAPLLHLEAGALVS